MAAFSDVVMHHLEACRIQTHEEVKYGIKKSARVLGRKCVGRLNRNKRHPQQRRNPGLEYLLLFGGQERASPASWKSTGLFKEGLLDSIVRSFPSNHHVVHMALPQPSS